MTTQEDDLKNKINNTKHELIKGEPRKSIKQKEITIRDELRCNGKNEEISTKANQHTCINVADQTLYNLDCKPVRVYVKRQRQNKKRKKRGHIPSMKGQRNVQSINK